VSPDPLLGIAIGDTDTDETIPPPTDTDAPETITRNGQQPRRHPTPVDYDLEAEQIALGAMLHGQARTLFDIVSVDEFYSDIHTQIASVIARLDSQDAPTDPVAVWGALSLTQRDQLDGGAAYLHTLYASVPSVTLAPYHARTVAEHARRRQIRDAALHASQALSDGRDTSQVLGELRNVLNALPDATQTPAEHARVVSGAAFALDAPTTTQAIWGRGDEVLWAREEPLMIVSPTGIGKTTIAQRLVLAHLGIGDPSLLGYPVEIAEQPILYIAADRPRQAAKSLRRMTSEEDRDALERGLIVWRGPLPFDPIADPARLLSWTRSFGAGSIIFDSLKDVAPSLTKDDAGAMIAQGWQHLVADGVDVLALHHQRKAQADNRKPKSIADVYGSVLVPAAAGTVILLWGEPGDPIIELSMLKLSESEVGPLQIEIDHLAGTVGVGQHGDLIGILRQSSDGLAAFDAAKVLYDTTKPTAAQKERARRALNRLTDAGRARLDPGSGRGGEPLRWYAISPLEESEPDPQEDLFS